MATQKVVIDDYVKVIRIRIVADPRVAYEDDKLKASQMVFEAIQDYLERRAPEKSGTHFALKTVRTHRNSEKLTREFEFRRV